ncbi:hypothetical protein U1Q18_024740 [Sarracenia purpurea var. burkii]
MGGFPIIVPWMKEDVLWLWLGRYMPSVCHWSDAGRSGYVSIGVLADWSDRHGTRGLSRAIRKVGRSDRSWAQALVLG